MKPERPMAEMVVQRLFDAFPRAWAEPWDRVGLLIGDPAAEVAQAFVTLDLDTHTWQRAQDAGADLIVTHHPPFLEPPPDMTRPPGAAATAFDALRAGVSVASFHTNLDRAPAGAEALAVHLSLTPTEPLESAPAEVDVLTTYVPDEALDEVLEAMARAGAGRIGHYDGCAFVAKGEGRFTPREDASPFAGVPGDPARESETRVEMVCSPETTDAAVAAARAVHPYEEPVLLATRHSLSRGAARLGRICPLEESMTLGGITKRVARMLGTAPRVWGSEDTTLSSVAVVGGSGSSLVGDAISAGADALVCGEVRYHVAQEALDAGLAIVEAGHDATEWPLVGVLTEAVQSATVDTGTEVVQDDPSFRWWTWGVRDDGPG